MLEDAACPTALAQYLSSLSEFWNSISEKGDEPNLRNARSCDLALTRYIDLSAKVGDPPSGGNTLRAAWEAVYPQFSRYGNECLPHFRRALKGWENLAPTTRRPKLPESICNALCQHLLDNDEKEVALCIKIMISAYLRPGEMFRIKLGDVRR